MPDDTTPFVQMPYTDEELKAALEASVLGTVRVPKENQDEWILKHSIAIDKFDLNPWQTLFKMFEHEEMTLFHVHDRKDNFMTLIVLFPPHAKVFWGMYTFQYTEESLRKLGFNKT